jgi:hypothetical protein
MTTAAVLKLFSPLFQNVFGGTLGGPIRKNKLA